jgi:hypothetical protein
MKCWGSGILYADDVGLRVSLIWAFVGGGALPTGA